MRTILIQFVGYVWTAMPPAHLCLTEDADSSRYVWTGPACPKPRSRSGLRTDKARWPAGTLSSVCVGRTAELQSSGPVMHFVLPMMGCRELGSQALPGLCRCVDSVRAYKQAEAAANLGAAAPALTCVSLSHDGYPFGYWF
jgi:hypothetical protein